MSIETITSAGAQWLWDQYGKNLTDKALGKAKQQWARFRWQDAESEYRARVREIHGTTRLLGNPKPIIIEDIYTDVYVLDRPTAVRRFSLRELQTRPLKRKSLRLDEQRSPALRLAVTQTRLFILGKPGSGKTTFLKFLALQACSGKIPKTPIFVDLKEFASSGMSLIPFCVAQFSICAFPEAQKFIEQLLDNGNAIIFLDGLDEVSMDDDRRTKVIRSINQLTNRYPRAHVCLTCRIAGTTYSFDQFTYIELADFDDRQVRLFANKWYKGDSTGLDSFLTELNSPQNDGLRELAQTPLLLALLCLAFDQLGHLPARRVELYKEALDALLKKWDDSRLVRRDAIYRNLTLVNKQQLLAHLANRNFQRGVYFMPLDVLAGQISRYLQPYGLLDENSVPDGEAVLLAIVMQHGILAERAHEIYSFSHLTFQEYYTARYIVNNADADTVTRLIEDHCTDDRWYEVFLLTASMLENTDSFFELLIQVSSKMITSDERFLALLHWVNEKAAVTEQYGAAARAILLGTALERSRNRLDPSHSLELAQSLRDIVDLARILIGNYRSSRGLLSSVRFGRALGDYSFTQDVHFWNDERIELISEYLGANRLLVECLELASPSNRPEIEAKLFTPPRG